MPQELHVLKCYSCNMFQVHIVKTSIQWNCKICGKKQSLTKVFWRGTGKECRVIVQKLNEMYRYQSNFEEGGTLAMENNLTEVKKQQFATASDYENELFKCLNQENASKDENMKKQN